jgi:hypothetical protein
VETAFPKRLCSNEELKSARVGVQVGIQLPVLGCIAKKKNQKKLKTNAIMLRLRQTSWVCLRTS